MNVNFKVNEQKKPSCRRLLEGDYVSAAAMLISDVNRLSFRKISPFFAGLEEMAGNTANKAPMTAPGSSQSRMSA